MSKNSTDRPGNESIWQSIDELPTDDLEYLRKTLNARARQRRFERLHRALERATEGECLSAKQLGATAATFTKFAAAQLDFDDDDSVIGTGMRSVLTSLFTCTSIFFEQTGDRPHDLDDPSEELENACMDFQASVILMRQATAQAIATIKQLEETTKKNKAMAATWQERADTARSQNNEDLLKQAEQRRNQFQSTVEDLEKQTSDQRQATASLRARLTQLETELQKMQSRKQMLIARHRALKATNLARKALKETGRESAVWRRAEQAITEAARELAKEILQEQK
jgi:phage shock protein A